MNFTMLMNHNAMPIYAIVIYGVYRGLMFAGLELPLGQPIDYPDCVPALLLLAHRSLSVCVYDPAADLA